MANPEFLTDLGVSLKLVVSGFWGGVCHIFVFRQTDPWTAVGSVVVGVATANYLGPLAINYVGTWLGELGSGFVVGLCSMVICQGLVEAVKAWKFSSKQDKG